MPLGENLGENIEFNLDNFLNLDDFSERVEEVMGNFGSLEEILLQIEQALSQLLADWGLSLSDTETPSQLNSNFRIYSEGNFSYLIHPESRNRVEVDASYDLDGDGSFSREELQDYISYVRELESDSFDTDDDRNDPDISHSAELQDLLYTHMRHLQSTVAGNVDLDNASADEVRRSSERPGGAPEGIGERVPGSPLYNLKYRMPNAKGGNMLTSGVPGSENANENRQEARGQYPEWADLSDEAFDVMYGYRVHNISHIFSLSYHGELRDAVRELENGGYIQRGAIEFDGDSYSTSSETLTQENMQVVADAYRMYRNCPPGESFLSRCTHGAHRAVFTMVACYMIENNCTREEAELANGVRHSFIDRYPEFSGQLDQVYNNIDEIRSLSGA